MIYEKFPEKAAELGGIDIIGVVSKVNSTAVTFAGASVLKKYFDGTKKIQLTLQITGMAEIKDQKELTERLCGILNSLVYGKWDIDGISQPSDWTSNFTKYLTRENGAFAAVKGDKSPAWVEGKYYSKNTESTE